MKTPLVILFAVIFSNILSAQTINSNTKSLMETELAFSKRCVEVGISPSFLEYFTDDGIVFRPQPESSKKVYTERNPKGVLNWWPVFADVSFSGDMGISTGPWEYHRAQLSDPILAYGYFVSVWKKQKDGSWKVAIDLGIDTPEVIKRDSLIYTGSPKITGGNFKNDVMDFDRKFSETYSVQSYEKNLSDQVRFYRNNLFPMTQNSEILSYLNQNETEMTFKPMEFSVSNSNDMGYTYGSVEKKNGKEISSGYYVKIWKRNSEGNWKLVIDILLENKKE